MPSILTAETAVTLGRFATSHGEALQTIPQLLRRNAVETPGRTAFRTMTSHGEWAGQSWQQVYEAVTEVAAGLIGLETEYGARPPGQVGYVIGANAPEFFIAEYAVQASGITAFPLFEQMSTPEMTATLASYPADAAFSGSADATARLLGAADELGIRMVVQWGADAVADDPRVTSLDELRARGRAVLEADPAAVDRRIDAGSLDDIACVILTSGTTGISKGVLGSHRYMLDIATRYAYVYGAKACDSYLSYLPAAFSVEQYNGLTLGAALPLGIAFISSPAAVAEEFVSSRSSMKFLVPRQWEGLRSALPGEVLNDPATIAARKLEIRAELGLQHVTGGISAGGSLSADVFAFFRQIGLHIRNVYGFAEVGIITGTRDDDPPDSAGIPLPSAYGADPIRVRIQDGEIQVHGGVMCSDYWGDTHQLSHTGDGWLRSGDAGVIDGGVLRVLDRLANIQHLPDGRTFAPQPIEISALRSPFIANILLIGGHGDDSRIAALLQLNEAATRRHLAARDALPEPYEALVRSSSVVALLVQEIQKTNAEQPASQRIRLIGILPRPLSPEAGELTRSMKLRRGEVLRRYADFVEAMFTRPEGLVTFMTADSGGSQQRSSAGIAHLEII